MNQPKTAIWKFALRMDEVEQRYMWPYIVEILDIQWQIDQPVLWAVVYPETAKRLYKIMRFLTGEETYGTNAYFGTVQTPTGDVLHYFSGGPSL